MLPQHSYGSSIPAYETVSRIYMFPARNHPLLQLRRARRGNVFTGGTPESYPILPVPLSHKNLRVAGCVAGDRYDFEPSQADRSRFIGNRGSHPSIGPRAAEKRGTGNVPAIPRKNADQPLPG